MEGLTSRHKPYPLKSWTTTACLVTLLTCWCCKLKFITSKWLWLRPGDCLLDDDNAASGYRWSPPPALPFELCKLTGQKQKAVWAGGTWSMATQFHTTMICTSNTFLSIWRIFFLNFFALPAQINTQIWISIGNPHGGDEGWLYPGNASHSQEGSPAGSPHARNSWYLCNMGAYGTQVRIR